MTLTPKGTIAREGRINFGDASLGVWEEGLNSHMTYQQRDAWELAFKRQVFARIIQTLNRLGWTVGPWSDAEKYQSIALSHRTCRKGYLHGELSVSGRHIEFQMWQDFTPSENPNGGRYDFDKEKRMPYVIRLEMERTRRRIRDYLCGVFEDYVFDPLNRSHERKPLRITAMDRISEKFAKDKGPREPSIYDRKSADGQLLQNGMRVFFFDWKGRIGSGIAYCDGGMWDVVTGRWDWTRESNNALYATLPDNPRVKRNQRLRRQRLEDLLAASVKAMDFRRAEALKNILWPKPEPMFHITKAGAYFRPNYSGYTNDQVQAGKYTHAELKPYADQIQRGTLQAVPIGAPA